MGYSARKFPGTMWAQNPRPGPTCGQQGLRLQIQTPPHAASQLASHASCPETRWSQDPLASLPPWAQRNSGVYDRWQPPGVVLTPGSHTREAEAVPCWENPPLGRVPPHLPAGPLLGLTGGGQRMPGQACFSEWFTANAFLGH